MHRKSSRFCGCIALEFTRERLAGSSSPLWNNSSFSSSSSSFICHRCFLLLYSVSSTLYSRFAHSLLFRYFILLLYNHFSCFFSTSFCREPHLLSIFARWVCIGYSFSWDQRVRNIMRYAAENFLFFSFSPSPLFSFALCT